MLCVEQKLQGWNFDPLVESCALTEFQPIVKNRQGSWYPKLQVNLVLYKQKNANGCSDREHSIQQGTVIIVE